MVEILTVEQVGIGQRAMDTLMLQLDETNAMEFVTNLIEWLGSRDEMVAFGAASILASTTHCINARINQDEKEENDWFIPAIGSDRFIDDDDPSSCLAWRDKLIYDILSDEEINRSFYVGLVNCYLRYDNDGFRTALAENMANGICAIGVCPDHLAVFKSNVEHLLDLTGNNEIRALLECAISIADHDMEEMMEL